MEMLKFGKFAALALALSVAVGCSSKGGEDAGQGGAAVDPNAGYGANTGAVDGSLSEEAALRAITTFYFEYDSSDLKPEALRALDVHAKDLKANGARVVRILGIDRRSLYRRLEEPRHDPKSSDNSNGAHAAGHTRTPTSPPAHGPGHGSNGHGASSGASSAAASAGHPGEAE
jgi:hypothetical protein